MALKNPTMKGTPVLSALAVASTLALAACGEATESGNTDASTSATTTATTEADREICADHDDTDIMFAQMMIPHHQQAGAREDYYNPIASLCGFTGVSGQQTQICSQIR